MQAIEVIFNLGSLTVWREANIDMFGNINQQSAQYYWKDAGSPQGFGPFIDTYAAMDHYRGLVQKFKNNRDLVNNPPLADVIRVDFQAKKRVSFDGDGI